MALNIKTASIELPVDLVKHEILPRLPTKVIVCISFMCKQYEDVLSCLPTLDFYEGGGMFKNNGKLFKFVNVLKRSLSICRNAKEQRELDKIRLHMTKYFPQDAVIVSKWLSYSLARSVKEIDISLKFSRPYHWDIYNCYCLSTTSFMNAKYLTTLNLEYVRLIDDNRERYKHVPDARLFPSLKKMSFKNVYFDGDSYDDLMGECPAIETLSFVSCSWEYVHFFVVSSSLKSLVIDGCNVRSVGIRSASNIESIRVVSNKSLQLFLLSGRCYNLKNMDLFDNCRLGEVRVGECNNMKGTIYAPDLREFGYEGYLSSTISLGAPKLELVEIDITLDDWGSFDPLEHFSKLKDFLEEVGYSKKVIFVVRDVKTLIFPEDFRRSISSSILPDVEEVAYETTVTPIEEDEEELMKDKEELMKSFRWMAPSATNIYELKYVE